MNPPGSESIGSVKQKPAKGAKMFQEKGAEGVRKLDRKWAIPLIWTGIVKGEAEL